MQLLFYRIRWYAGMAVLLCLGITVMKYSAWIDRKVFGPSPKQAGAQAPQLGVARAGSGAQPASPDEVRAQLVKMRGLLGEARASAAEALAQILVWQTEVESLDDVRLDESPDAGDEERTHLLDRLSFVRRRERASAAEIRDALTEIETLQANVEGLVGQAHPQGLAPREAAEASELHDECRAAQQEWRRDVAYALAIKRLLAARGAVPAGAQADSTLGAQLDDADARGLVAALDDEIAADARDRAEQLAEKAARDRSAREQEERDAALRTAATSPEVKAILAPFLKPRNVQPRLAGSSIVFSRTTEIQPTSLAALIGVNALADTEEGLVRLAKVGSHRQLESPRWSFNSPGRWSAEDRAILEQAQQMLRDYGAILVEAGLLSQ